MKGGSSPTQTIKSEDNASPFSNLPIEIKTKILDYLPHYQRVGKDTAKRVSKEWAKLLSKPQVTRSSILASCKTSADALNILRKEELTQYFSWSQLIEIASHHPAIALKLVIHPAFKRWLADANRIDGEHILSLYRERKSNFLTLMGIGKYHLEIAEQLYQSLLTEFPQAHHFHRIAYTYLATCHRGIAENLWRHLRADENHLEIDPPLHQLFLKELLPQRFSPLYRAAYTYLATRYQAIDEEKEDVLNSLSSSQLIQIAMAHSEDLAWHIFNENKPEWTVNDLACLGRNFPEIGLFIIREIQSNQRLQNKFILRPHELAALGQDNFEIAREIINTPVLQEALSRSDLAILGKNNQEIRQFILEKTVLRNKLTLENKIVLAQNDIEYARKIISTTTQENDGETSANLVKLARCHPELLNEVLDRLRIIEKEYFSEAEHLFEFCLLQQEDDSDLSYPPLDEAIASRALNAFFADPRVHGNDKRVEDIINRLDGDDFDRVFDMMDALPKLGSLFESIATQMLENKFLLSCAIDGRALGEHRADNLGRLGSGSRKVASRILFDERLKLNGHSLRSQLDSEAILKLLKGRSDLFKQALADDFLSELLEIRNNDFFNFFKEMPVDVIRQVNQDGYPILKLLGENKLQLLQQRVEIASTLTAIAKEIAKQEEQKQQESFRASEERPSMLCQFTKERMNSANSQEERKIKEVTYVSVQEQNRHRTCGQ